MQTARFGERRLREGLVASQAGRCCECPPRSAEMRTQLDSAAEIADCLVKAASDHVAHAGRGVIGRSTEIAWAQACSDREVVKAVLRHAAVTERGTKNHVGNGHARVELDRLAKRGDRGVEFAADHMHIPGSKVRPRIFSVAAKGAQGRRARGLQGLGALIQSQLHASCLRPREQAVGPRVVGVDICGAAQQLLGRGDFGSGAPRPSGGHRPHHEAPGIEITRRPDACALMFSRVEARLDRRNHGAGNAILKVKEGLEVAVVAVGPDLKPARRVAEFACDAHPSAERRTLPARM